VKVLRLLYQWGMVSMAGMDMDMVTDTIRRTIDRHTGQIDLIDLVLNILLENRIDQLLCHPDRLQGHLDHRWVDQQ
jgi:hypothetical protein